jgi:hypothetical protein
MQGDHVSDEHYVEAGKARRNVAEDAYLNSLGDDILKIVDGTRYCCYDIGARLWRQKFYSAVQQTDRPTKFTNDLAIASKTVFERALGRLGIKHGLRSPLSDIIQQVLSNKIKNVLF